MVQQVTMGNRVFLKRDKHMGRLWQESGHVAEEEHVKGGEQHLTKKD